MNGREPFLSRWARRKREAAKEARDESEPQLPQAPEANESGAMADGAGTIADQARARAHAPLSTAGKPSFDPGTLPPVETITAATDIRPFLAPGVPAELVRAALRRAWAADPKIRDFIGLADYAWDYHTPGSMPGFEALEMTDALRQGVARIMGSAGMEADKGTVPVAHGRPTEDVSEFAARQALSEHTEPGIAGMSQEFIPNRNRVANDRAETPQGGEEVIAPQHSVDRQISLSNISPHRHGRALPK
jgi:hypothetical protein